MKVGGGFNGYLSKIRGLILLLLALGGFGLSPSVQAVTKCDVATPLKINASTGLILPVAGQLKYFKVTAPSDGLLTILATSNAAVGITLYDNSCIQFAFSSNGQSLSTQIPKNTYFVAINASDSYKLQVDGDFANDDRGINCPSAGVVRSLSESGVFGPYGDSDFFLIKLIGAGRLIANVQATGGIGIRVFDQNCFLITSSTNGHSIDSTLPPGNYYLNLFEGGNNAKGNYIVNFTGSNIQFPTGTCGGKLANFSGTNGNDVIRGTAGNDVIQAFGGNDVIYGLTGDDTLCGGTGDDVLQGGGTG